MQTILSGVISIFYYAMVIALLWKIFQMATDLNEMKAILADIRRNTASAATPAEIPVPAPAAIASPVATPVYVPAPVHVAAPAAVPVAAYVAPPAQMAAPVQAPILSGPISLESAEALLREIAAEAEALEAAQRTKVG